MQRFLNKIRPLAPTLIAIAATFIWVCLQSYYKLHRPRLSTDFISFALSSTAPLLNIGMPYVDFWGINPPGLLLMLGSWATLFGISLHSFHLLYLISLAVISMLTWHILYKIAPRSLAVALFFIWGVLFFSNTVQSQFFPSEINGLLLTMIGLTIVFRKQLSHSQVFWSCFMFVLAGQMKEVYALSGLVLIPHLLLALHQGTKKALQFSLAAFLGITGAGAITVGYLVLTQSWAAYLNIMRFKSQHFSITDLSLVLSRLLTALEMPRSLYFYPKYSVFLVLVVSFFAFLTWLSRHISSRVNNSVVHLKLQVSEQSLLYFLSVCYFLGALLGYTLQNRYGNKYDIPILLPTIIILALAVKITVQAIFSLVPKLSTRNKNILQDICSFALTLVILLPQKSFLIEQFTLLRGYHPIAHARMWMNAEHPEHLKLEQKITATTQPSDCITKIYGWGVGDAYYYSQRRSCSKHFLVNLLPPSEAEAYAHDIIRSSPAAIIYNTKATDLNYTEFEKNVYNFPLILESCYAQDTEFPALFWPKIEGEALRECLQLGLPQQAI